MSNPPSTSVLPRHVDPRKFAAQRISISGEIELPLLTRLTPLLAGEQGKVEAQLDFSIDEQGVRCLTGTASATVEMVCQRCLEAAEQPVEASLNLAMIWSDEDAKQLPKTRDPWVVGEGQVDLYSVVEDELILSLPIVAYHDHACVPESQYSAGEENDEPAAKKNPFQVLEQLKKK